MNKKLLGFLAAIVGVILIGFIIYAVTSKDDSNGVSDDVYEETTATTAATEATTTAVEGVDAAAVSVDFEDQTTGGFAGRAGTESLTVTNEDNHTEGGSYALKVENRTESWHGPMLRVEGALEVGYEYKISVWVKMISLGSADLQLSTQVGNASPTYNNITKSSVNADDGWVELTGLYRYASVADDFVTIYVESPNGAVSFYIDDIRLEKTDNGPVSIQSDLVPIKDAYQDDFLMGNAVSLADFSGERFNMLKMHYNVITAENTMKPEAIQKEKGKFTFDGADALITAAKDNGFLVHGHVLVWHQQSPTWMFSSADGTPLSREEALENMRTHIRTTMEHFGNNVISWDVVNEAIDDSLASPEDWKKGLRQSLWFQAIGEDYVEQAFLAAREVLDEHPDWDIVLYYNDYNDDNQKKAETIYSMVKELNDKYAKDHPGKLLIDGVGMQGHYNSSTNPENVRASLERFATLGVEISITELDIQAGSNSVQTEEEAKAQGYLYAKLMSIFRENADVVERVTFWGLNDGTSWRAATSPLLFDADLQAKQSYYGVIDPDTYMAENAPVVKEARETTAKYGTPSIDGKIDDVWSSAEEVVTDTYQTAWQGATGVVKALWDDKNLYVLFQVTDQQLDKTSPNVWEQDSIEVFLDQLNDKATSYQADDGQYRVNFDNEATFNPEGIDPGFESATKVDGTSYVVEVKIPWTAITPKEGTKVGYDVQVNDGKDGARQSVASWNDDGGTGYMDPSVYGILNLVQ